MWLLKMRSKVRCHASRPASTYIYAPQAGKAMHVSSTARWDRIQRPRAFNRSGGIVSIIIRELYAGEAHSGMRVSCLGVALVEKIVPQHIHNHTQHFSADKAGTAKVTGELRCSKLSGSRWLLVVGRRRC